ncbi:MAG: DUF1858 domain-containing protein [candidate division Zixibacteria bacterium]|nr:DUF1858 domain-containing protein [candidate division Zixibacteria bacterium]MDD5427393.1 DUF1858 domain-containing protein [candidate division Zixibacteria bacterium]
MGIKKDILIEDLIRTYPQAVRFLINNHLPCVVCGEPFWGTLEELARQEGWDSERIENLVTSFNGQLG